MIFTGFTNQPVTEIAGTDHGTDSAVIKVFPVTNIHNGTFRRGNIQINDTDPFTAAIHDNIVTVTLRRQRIELEFKCFSGENMHTFAQHTIIQLLFIKNSKKLLGTAGGKKIPESGNRKSLLLFFPLQVPHLAELYCRSGLFRKLRDTAQIELP